MSHSNFDYHENPDDPIAKQIMDFNQAVFAFEDERLIEICHLIDLVDSLQQSLHLPQSSGLLKESLAYIMEARSQEELEVYRNSFLAALEKTKLKDVLDIDSCINTLTRIADDLFYWSDLEIDANLKQLSDNAVLEDLLREAQSVIEQFNRHAADLETTFQRRMNRNIERLAQHKNISKLQEQDLKYLAGIKRIHTQRAQVARAFEVIKEIRTAKTAQERQNTRANFALAIHELRLVDKRTGYNHFVTQCQTSLTELCIARSSYLEAEEPSLGEPLSVLAQTATSMSVPYLTSIPALSSIPSSLPGFAHSLIMRGTRYAFGQNSQLGQREPVVPPPPPTWLDRAKQGLSFLLGAAGLILGGLLCLTVLGIPKGVSIAATSVGIINAARGGRDFYSDNRDKIRRNEMLMERLTSLEQKHDALDQERQAQEKTSKKQHDIFMKKHKGSATKIDLLLMGHKPGEILSEDEMDALNKTHQMALAKGYTPVEKPDITAPSQEIDSTNKPKSSF
ncbi:MAG: hypothetical protein ACYCQI_14415 [Gammaproteobacteria bacterium]